MDVQVLCMHKLSQRSLFGGNDSFHLNIRLMNQTVVTTVCMYG